MYSVFSQVIIERWKLEQKATTRSAKVPTDIPDIENIIEDNIYPQVMYCHVISTLDYIVEDAIYTLCNNKDVQKLMNWVCKNIIQKIPQDTHKTMNVKLRIAVDMLNKLEDEGKISKEMNLFYFDNIISNCNDLWFDIFFGESINELPF